MVPLVGNQKLDFLKCLAALWEKAFVLITIDFVLKDVCLHKNLRHFFHILECVMMILFLLTAPAECSSIF